MHAWHCRSRQEPTMEDPIRLTGESTTILLLSRQAITLPSKFTSQYPQWGQPSGLIRDISLYSGQQLMQKLTTQCRKSGSVECSATSRTTASPFPAVCRDRLRRGGGRLSVSSGPDTTCAQELIAIGCLHKTSTWSKQSASQRGWGLLHPSLGSEVDS